MSHDDLRALLPAYAAGALAPAEADTIRAHLADGCATCLTEMFRRPVGLPRAAAPVTTAGRASAATRLGVAALVAIALWMATLAGWMQVGLRRERDAARTDARQLAARLAADGELKTALAARAARLERELEAARGEVGAQTDAVRATAEAGAALERDLADARVHVDVLTRALRRRATGGLRVVPPPDGASGNVAEALIASPGTQLVALEPAPPFHDVRGHVLWHPAQDELILYAFDLPPLPDGAGYRIRLTFEGERVEERLAFRAPASGRMVQPVALAGASAWLRVVEVVLEPAGRAVLVGRTHPPAP